MTPCNHPEPLSETCYQKIPSCPLCRAPFDDDMPPLKSLENNDLIDNGEMLRAVVYDVEAVVRSMLDGWVNYYDLIMVIATCNDHKKHSKVTVRSRS